VNTRLLTIAVVVTSAAGGMVVARDAGWSLTLPAGTQAWIVGLGALAASGLALGLARVAGIPAMGRRLVAPPRPVGEAFEELADLAELARQDGLLPATADPRASRYPVLGAGFHLLMRDSDEKLVRSALAAEEEVECRRLEGARSIGAAVCRIGLLVLTAAAACAAVLLAARKNAPWAMPSAAAAGMFAVIVGFFLWTSLGGRLASALEARNAEDVLLADASVLTVLAIQDGSDRRATLDRLARLLPAGNQDHDPTAMARKAA
jgi:flagellar motor component MotA